MKGKQIIYSQEELDFVKANCKLPTKEQHRLFQIKFNRPEISSKHLNNLRKRKGWLTGRDGRFKKGSVPPNKGKKGYCHPGSVATQFKKGSVPANVKPMYYERINVQGYIEIKVPERNPHTGAPTRFRLKHQWVWEQHNDPVPDGFILHFIDGDRKNCSIENLEVIPRAVGVIMNKKRHSSLPDEIKPVVKTLAKVQHKQRQRQNQLKEK